MNSILICWICNKEPATTGEHKFPHAYLKRIPDDWRDLVHGRWDGTGFGKHGTQGPNSKNLKLKVLCVRCNTTVTQSQDRTLDKFLLGLESKLDEIWTSRKIDLSEYDAQDLYRALLKMEFSRLYADGINILPEISQFVAGCNNMRDVNDHVRIEFRVTESAESFGIKYPFESNAPYYRSPYFISHQINFGWLGVHFVYAPEECPSLPWPSWGHSIVSLTPGDYEDGYLPRL